MSLTGREAAGCLETRGEFASLDRAESLRLLATVPVGRLIFTVMRCLPCG
jgi:hypothetical protein